MIFIEKVKEVDSKNCDNDESEEKFGMLKFILIILFFFMVKIDSNIKNSEIGDN